MIKKLSFVLILFFSSSLAFSSNSPDGFLKNSVVEISDLVSKYKDRFESDEAFLRSKMNSVVMPKLDVKLMSKIVLGKKIWTNMPEDQQESFVEAFKYRMTSTYMKSITAFDGGKIKDMADNNIHIPTGSGEYGPAEDIHMILAGLVGSFLIRFVLDENK